MWLSPARQAPLHVENPLQNIVFKSITLKTVHGRKIFHTWIESEKLVHEKKYDNINFMINDKYKLYN